MGSGVADLQGEVKRDLLLSDARQVQSTLGRDLVYPVAALNGLVDDPRRAPVWRFDTREPQDLTAFSTSLQRLTASGMGAFIPVAWVREQTGIPEPAGDEPTLGAGASRPGAAGEPAVPADEITALAAAATGRGETPRLPPDYAETHTAALARLAEPAMLAMAAAVRGELDAALAAGEDMASFNARLLGMYPELPGGSLVAVLAEGLAAADLAGRYDIDHGA
jgi:phage gp29-like protein